MKRAYSHLKTLAFALAMGVTVSICFSSCCPWWYEHHGSHHGYGGRGGYGGGGYGGGGYYGGSHHRGGPNAETEDTMIFE